MGFVIAIGSAVIESIADIFANPEKAYIILP